MPGPEVPPETLERYRKIACEAVRGLDGRECTFVSGSLVEGIGNATSDLDVFVVTDERAAAGQTRAAAFSFGASQVLIDFVGEDRVDVELWSRETVLHTASALRDCDPHDTPAAVNFDDREIQLAHRIRVGVAAEGAEVFAALQREFDWERLSQVLRTRFLNEYNGWAEDAIGAVQAGDGPTAMLQSRLALGCAVDAYLAARGSTNAKPKWRFVKLRQLGDEELTRTYLELELDADPSPEALLATARRRLRRASMLASRAISGG